jgi:hypothetical protein
VVYVGWHEFAALQWDGYSRVSNAISELHLTGAPSKWLLDPWEGLVYSALVIAFGIGVWQSAQGSRALRIIGCFLVLPGATFPLWLLFGEASLAAHIALSLVSVLAMLGAMGLGAAALGRRFRLYSLVTLAIVVAFFGRAFAYAPQVAAGESTPWMGLSERVAFGAYFSWLFVLAVALWHKRASGGEREGVTIGRRLDVPSRDVPANDGQLASGTRPAIGSDVAGRRHGMPTRLER